MATGADTEREAIRALVREKFGFVPNLVESLLVSPAVARVYLEGSGVLSGGSLPAAAQQAVQLTVSTANGCGYCGGAHAALAKSEGVADEDAKAMRAGELPADPDLAKYVAATRLVMEKQGWLEAEDLAALEGQGVSREQLYEIIGFIGLKTITNYINHIAGTRLDQELGG